MSSDRADGRSQAGYVRLFRKLLQHPIWVQLQPAVIKVAIYFLLRANYKPCKWYDGDQIIDIPAGAFICSYASAARDCNVSIQQARDAFRHLFTTHFATYRRTHRWTLVSVVNFASYQATQGDENTVENTEENIQGTLDKEIKNRRSNTCASKIDAQGSLPSIDNPPFGTTEPVGLFPDAPVEPSGKQQQTARFEQWWGQYWSKKARQSAETAFRKHVNSEAKFRQVMVATLAQQGEMLSREPSKRPYGATWLNGARWLDEPEAPARAATEAAVDYPEYDSNGEPV